MGSNTLGDRQQRKGGVVRRLQETTSGIELVLLPNGDLLPVAYIAFETQRRMQLPGCAEMDEVRAWGPDVNVHVHVVLRMQSFHLRLSNFARACVRPWRASSCTLQTAAPSWCST